MVTRSKWFEYGSRCRRSAACSRDASASASRTRPRSAAANRVDLHQQPLPQAGLAVHGGDRVQRHPGQQPPFGRVQIRSGPTSARRFPRPPAPPPLQANYARHATRRVTSASVGRDSMIMPGIPEHSPRPQRPSRRYRRQAPGDCETAGQRSQPWRKAARPTFAQALVTCSEAAAVVCAASMA
jgi:hypothetical protein